MSKSAGHSALVPLGLAHKPAGAIDLARLMALVVQRSGTASAARVTGLSRGAVTAIVARVAQRGSIALAANHVEELCALAGIKLEDAPRG